jgi:hypothetical protein
MFSTVILQFGGNDADRDIEIHDFNRNYLNIIQEIQKCNEVKHIVVGAVVFSFKVFVLMSLVIELPMMSTFPVFF